MIIRQQIQEILDNDYNTKQKVKEDGEVFTPFNLIEEMLDKLPTDVWYDPNKTWLDPVAGLGNFHCVVAERLMKSLATQIKNKEERYKHIVENQLYFIEINPRSCVWIRRLFNPHRKYKLNLVCADMLDPNHPGWNEVGYMWDEKIFDEHGNKIEQEKINKFMG